MVCGVKKVPFKRKLPLCLAHLQTFVDITHCMGSYDDYLRVILLLCAFYDCHHMGELVQMNDCDLFDWRKIIKQASVSFEHGHAQYHLPYHKSDPFYCGTNVIFTPQDVADPVTPLQSTSPFIIISMVPRQPCFFGKMVLAPHDDRSTSQLELQNNFQMFWQPTIRFPWQSEPL